MEKGHSQGILLVLASLSLKEAVQLLNLKLNNFILSALPVFTNCLCFPEDLA